MRRTSLICLVVGFVAGIVATNIFSSLQVGHGEVKRKRVALMEHRQNNREDARFIYIVDDHAQKEDGSHGHHHNHDHNNDSSDDDATSENVSSQIDVPATDTLVHQGCVCVILHFCAGVWVEECPSFTSQPGNKNICRY